MSPIARAVRTFAAGMVGVLGAVVIAAQASDWSAGLTVLTLGVATSALAAIIAGALAWKDVVATSPAGKALATFLQVAAAGLATVTFASYADLANFGHVALPILVAAAFAAAQTFVQNVAEGSA